MQQLCVDSLVTCVQFLHIVHPSLVRELDQSGWTIYTVLELNQDLTNVHTMESEYITVSTLRMLAFNAQVIDYRLYGLNYTYAITTNSA